MKKLLLVLLFVPLVSFGQDAFSNGYKAGYKKGYCLEDINCIPPIPPVLTISKPGFSTYSDGYARGVSDGKKAKSSNTVKRKSGQNALISGARDLGRSNIPTYTPNTNSYSASTRKSPSNQYTQTRSTNSDLRTLKYLERQRHKNNLKIIKLKYKGKQRKRNILYEKQRHSQALQDAARSVINNLIQNSKNGR